MIGQSFACVAALVLGGCGSSIHAEPDAPVDAGADAAADAAVPTGCDEFVPDGNRACIPAGRFWFGVISDDQSPHPEPPACYPDDWLQAVNSCAHELDIGALEIDLREVSVGEYAQAVARGVVPAPPELCESAGFVVDDSDCDLEAFGRTGFDPSGEAMADWADLPVSCVRKAEARHYCEWRGGRLPLSTEWMKAARGASPSRREIPWADHVPLPFEDWGRLAAWDYAENADGKGGEPTCDGLVPGSRQAVTSRPENASPYGLLHVLGNVREWVDVAASGDLYETAHVDVFGFGEVRLSSLYAPGSPRISSGVAAEEGLGEVLQPTERDHTLGFRCAYDR